MYIQSLDRFTSHTPNPKNRDFFPNTKHKEAKPTNLNQSFESIASFRQGKKKRVPVFVAARQCQERQLPEKNIFTSKGIMEVPLIVSSARKSVNKLKIKLQRRQKCLSFCDKLVSKPLPMPRAKTPKIMIKSVFNFSIGQRKHPNTLEPQQRPRNKTMRRSSSSHRRRPEAKPFLSIFPPPQKNDFIGWETDPFSDYLQTL